MFFFFFLMKFEALLSGIEVLKHISFQRKWSVDELVEMCPRDHGCNDRIIKTKEGYPWTTQGDRDTETQR